MGCGASTASVGIGASTELGDTSVTRGVLVVSPGRRISAARTCQPLQATNAVVAVAPSAALLAR